MENTERTLPAEEFQFVHADAEAFAPRESYAVTTFWHDVFSRLVKNKGAVLGIALIGIIAFMAVVMPIISPYTYKAVTLSHNYLPPRIPGLEKLGIFDGSINGVNVYAQRHISQYYFFGTDSLGRDLWTRLWNGTRISLLIAGISVAMDLVIGMSYGLISGYFGGKVDFIMQRIVEIINGIPQLVLVTLFVLVLQPGMVSIILALLISGWIPMSRVCRAEVLKQKEREYVLASRTLGVGHFRIIFQEIVPNVLGQVVITSMFSIPNAIFTESYLAFIGLGVRAPMASLGSLVSLGYQSFLSYPYMVIIPVTVLALLMISFNLAGDGLRDAFDPTLKEM